MRVLFIVSAFNGLTQRAWCALRAAGHYVTVEFAIDDNTMIAGAHLADPDIIICPYLKDRVPEAVWRRWPTIIIHPGPVGDRGPSSLDWAITNAEPVWGVTALQAVADMDTGPIWATRTFPMPADPPRKSSLYNGLVADAAIECIMEVLDKATDRDFEPTPLDQARRTVPGTGLRPLMRQTDRAFGWDEPGAHILRRIRAADSTPGVRTTIGGHDVHVYDAELTHIGRRAPRPGSVLGHNDDAVLVAAGDATGLWISQAKAPPGQGHGIKLPAVDVLGASALTNVRLAAGPRKIRYVRHNNDVGELTFHIYNGAFSPKWSRRLATALRKALASDTRTLILSGSTDVYSNGIDLNHIAAADDPAAAAWSSIRAINAVCRTIAADTSHVIIAAFTGPAGAGGVMLPLGADIVAARDGIILNPSYDIGLFGSELHTHSLPGRVGPTTARRLLDQRLPLDVPDATALGLVDHAGPRDPRGFERWLLDLAQQHAAPDRWQILLERKQRAYEAGRHLARAEAVELGEMALDMFDDRQHFSSQRAAFVAKRRPAVTPTRLALHRSPGCFPTRRVSAA